MFTGKTIDDLTALVQRAEAHADQDEQRNLPPWVIKVPATPRNQVAFDRPFPCGIGAA